MSTLILKRGNYSLRHQGRSRFGRVLSQVFWTCRQAFDQVDIDRVRNQVSNLPIIAWLFAGRETTLAFRKLVRDEATLRDRIFLPVFEGINQWHRLKKSPRLTPIEPIDIRAYTRIEKVALLAVMAAASVSLMTSYFGSSAVRNAAIQIATMASDSNSTAAKAIGPINWLDGGAESNGFRKDALTGPFKYAKDSGYEFAATKDRLIEMVSEGTLVELEETASLRFNNVSRPYVLPVVAEFVYRLADQYNYGQKCGPLVLNGAARDVAFQQTLGNGSKKSVHPTGMAVDIKSTGLSPRCQDWLEQTLLDIEAARRIDFTNEVSDNSPHYHVTVATHTYEAWLKRRRSVGDLDTDTLRTAMFYEGGSDETVDGYKAIGWVIRNRVRSTDYPNTIRGVVAEGSAGKSNGGCQFSFKCDGKPEDKYELCRNLAGKLTSYWRFKCDMRWEQVTVIAKTIMAGTEDPTGGATLYYATWMDPKPHWARPRTEVRADGKTVSLPYGDFAHEPVEIGNHYFGCSRFAGRDIRCGGES